MHTIVMRMQSAKLREMKNWFNVQPEPAKKPYRTPVNAIVAAYIPAVEPIRIHCHSLELEASQFSRQVSDQE